MKGLEIKGRLDRIGKTSLEHFQDIKELEVADEQGLTVKDILPYKCERVEKSLKALENIKEKDVDIFMLRRFKTLEAYNNYAKENKMKELTKEECDTLKEVLK